MTTSTYPLFVILGCGATKRDVACPAGEMYLGSMWQTFRKNAPKGRDLRVFVLSALHGLIEAETVIEPYEQTMTPAAADRLAADPEVKGRAARLWDELFGAAGSAGRDCEGYLIAGEAYAQVLERIIPEDGVFECLSDGDLLAKRSSLRKWLLSKAVEV